jgi:hypothetical protein
MYLPCPQNVEPCLVRIAIHASLGFGYLLPKTDWVLILPPRRFLIPLSYVKGKRNDKERDEIVKKLK